MKLRLTATAPIRVGGREQQVHKLEYVRYRGRLHAVSQQRLAARLLQKSARTLDDWTVEALRQGQWADLTAFLRDQGLLDDDTVREISRYSAPEAVRVKNEFQPHARDAFGNLFVPGSAIKGAVRAAVMWVLVDEARANAFVDGNRSTQANGYANALNERVLQGYDLPRAPSEAHRDLLRAVKVGDAYGDLRSSIQNIVVQTYEDDRRGGRTATRGASPVFAECLEPGSWAEFDLKVDKKVIEAFKSYNEELPFRDEKTLMDLVRNFYTAVWEFDRRYYGVGSNGKDRQKVGPPPDDEPSEEFPSQEEWITQKYGKLSKTQQRRYRGEYRQAKQEFEEAQKKGAEAERDPGVPAVKDGSEVRVGNLRRFYGGEPPGFRLGWGSGLMSTTVDMRLNEENVGRVLNMISSRHHPQATPREGPKSRKLVGEERNPRWPMGWAKLEVVNE